MDILRLFQEDKETQAIVLIGEIGGSAEEEAAEVIKKRLQNRLLVLLPGRRLRVANEWGMRGQLSRVTRERRYRKLLRLKVLALQ